MTLDQQETVRKCAKRAATADAMDEREATDARASWWAAEMSYDLGTVDRHGMVDVNGEIARTFRHEYQSIWREFLR